MHKKLVISGDIAELYEFEQEPIQRNSSRERAIELAHPELKTPKPRKLRKHSAHRRRDNVYRLRKQFIRLLRSNLTRCEKPQLLTVTFISNQIDLHEAYIEWRKFMQRLRRHYGKEFCYVAVPEFQDRGAVHFHAVTWGLPQEYGDNFKRTKVRTRVSNKYPTGERWLYKLSSHGTERRRHCIQRFWGYGYVNIRNTDGAPALAGYLGKYLTKSQFDERTYGEKAYVSSRNARRPQQVSGETAVYYASQEWLQGATVDKIAKFDTIHLGVCSYTRFNLKTNYDKEITVSIPGEKDWDEEW